MSATHPYLRLLSILALTFALAGCECGDGDDPDAGPEEMDAGDDGPPPPVIGDVPETDRFEMPGLTGRAYVVYTESNVPHVYAENEEDLARVQGFVTARDRFFVMDLGRRLMQGRLAELIGQDALETDMEQRGTGTAEIVDRVLERFTDDQRRVLQAYADGINFYIEKVRSRDAPLPSELEIAGPVLGAPRPATLLEDFTLRDMAAWAVVVLFESSFETGDVRRAQAAAQIDTLYTGEALEAERTAGLWDVFTRVTNVQGYTSSTGFGLEIGTGTMTAAPIIDPRAGAPRRAPTRPLPGPMFDRLVTHLDRITSRFGRDEEHGWGSNAWAIMGMHTADGAALVAGDPHLGGTAPTTFYRMGRDTELLGGGDIREVGVYVQGTPFLGTGTNGRVAWHGTQLFGDVTDWYREEIVLDASGAPMATVFEGGTRPVNAIDEEIVVADIPNLDSVGRTETMRRYETFDGRPITMIEGRELADGEMPGAGETAVNLLGTRIVPEDTDGDMVISAVSFDYVGLEGPNIGLSQSAWAEADNVMEMYNNQDALLGYSLNIVAGDQDGSVYYSGYQIMPCRDHLAREMDGSWSDGADPSLMLDGTRFSGFEIPLTPEGRVDEAAAAAGGPNECVIPHDRWPAVINPPSGFVVSANNDISPVASDNSVTNDEYYIGGPWEDDVRAVRIDALLTAARGSATEQTMADIQGDTQSQLGIYFLPFIEEAISDAEAAAGGTPAAGSPEERMAAMWTANQADYVAFRDRLQAWRDGGFRTPIGIETFYSSPGPSDPADSVATTLFNAWLGKMTDMAIGDERFPSGTTRPTGDTTRMRTLSRMFDGRGPGNPLMLAEYNAATEESAFFDVLGTPEIESSDEIVLRAIDQALAFLATDPTGPGAGGFGSDDWDTYLWGLRHYTTFDSLLTDFLGDDPQFSFLVDMFSINPARLPLMEGLDPSDPRAMLPGFPRPGDNGAVDWGQAGFNGERFTFGTIALLRMVTAVRGDATTGRNIMQGGQTAISDSEFYDDQTRLWLANETTPTRFSPEDVVAGATGRETFVPAP